MAASILALLALAAVGTLAEICTEQSAGWQVGIRHVLPVEIIPGGHSDYTVQIKNPCWLPANGIKVRVCDPDAPPSPGPMLDVTLTSAHVRRLGYPWQPATLNATVWCLLFKNQRDRMDLDEDVY